MQPALPTPVGKQFCVYVQDLLMDLRNIDRVKSDLRLRGVRGTTGTQASFLALFNNNYGKVKALDRLVTQKAGFSDAFTVTSQTYSRKIDVDIANVFASFGATAQRIGGDLRRLAALKEIEEPWETGQIGSSAMTYKRNSMRAERLCSLARYLSNFNQSAANTDAAQWLERTLDDSAIRRLYIVRPWPSPWARFLLRVSTARNVSVRRRVSFAPWQHYFRSNCLSSSHSTKSQRWASFHGDRTSSWPSYLGECRGKKLTNISVYVLTKQLEWLRSRAYQTIY